MDGQVEPRRRRGLQQRFKLREIQIIARRHPLKTVTRNEVFGRERIGDIEREITAFPIVCEEGEVILIEDQVPVGRA